MAARGSHGAHLRRIRLARSVPDPRPPERRGHAHPHPAELRALHGRRGTRSPTSRARWVSDPRPDGGRRGPSSLNRLNGGHTMEAHLTDGTIRYREEGSGEPLIFIQGLGVNSELWRNVVPKLVPSYRCIRGDWPLGGHSIPMASHADLSLPGLARLVVALM